MDGSNGAGDEDRTAPRSKVARLLQAYGLSDLGDELERRWTASGDDRLSVRDLVDVVNRRLLERALASADVRPLDGEVDNLYRILTDPDVGRAERTRARRRLEREGVDVEALESDFVSRQAVYTYLTSHRDATFEPDESTDIQTDVDAIGRFRSRLQAMVGDRVSRHQRAGAIDIADPQVLVDVRLYCESCGAEFAVADLAGGTVCDCE